MREKRRPPSGPYKLPDGDLMVPARAEGPKGVIGDGMLRVSPGDPDYEAWLAHVDDDPQEQR